MPRSSDYDLTHEDDAARLFADAEPELVFHLAAEVGGIGANRANPGRYWFANLAMGVNVLEQSRLTGVRKLVVAGTVCAYPKHTPVPFHEDDLWNGYPEETNAPYGIAKKALLVGAQAYREQYGLDTVFLLPANLYGPARQLPPATNVARDPGADPQDGRPNPRRSCCGATARPTREFLYVDDCAEALAARGRALRRRRAREPRHRRRDLDPRAGRPRRRADRLRRARSSGTRSMPNGQPRRSARRVAGAGAVRLHGADASCATGSSGRSPGTASRRPRMQRGLSALLERAAARLPPRRRDRGARRAPAARAGRRSRAAAGWSYSTGDAVARRALVTAELVLLYAVGRLLGGPLFALRRRRSSGSSRRSC